VVETTENEIAAAEGANTVAVAVGRDELVIAVEVEVAGTEIGELLFEQLEQQPGQLCLGKNNKFDE
jgi:hypothetical protein